MKASPDHLRGVPLFAELDDDDLGRIAERARVEEIAAGTVLLAEGSPPAAMYVILEGEFAVTKRGTGAPIALNVCGPGDLVGELSVLEGRPRTASVTATTAARVVVLDTAALHDLLRGSLAATLAILRTMATRIGNTESVLRQHDMLASLGKIAAGLAHELNNPAAAVQRGAVELEQRLAGFEHAALALRGLTDDQLARLPPPVAPPVETAIQRARRESALEDALAARGLADAYELAPALAQIGLDAAALPDLLAGLPAGAAPVALRWLAATTATRAIARDVVSAAGRITELVAAVRSHSHLDRAPVQDVDVHAGLDDTLALFRHRLRDVAVRRDYAADLPRITAYASELKQVWTNLVDNALDAMASIGTGGELTLATRAGGDHVVVEVVDNGPGIPRELQPEIYKPFVTTKPPGAGTGLGLHLAYTVVVARHRGRIELESRPGRTCFRITLPIR